MGVIGLLPATVDLGVSVVAVGKTFFGDDAFLPPAPKKYKNIVNNSGQFSIGLNFIFIFKSVR